MSLSSDNQWEQYSDLDKKSLPKDGNGSSNFDNSNAIQRQNNSFPHAMPQPTGLPWNIQDNSLSLNGPHPGVVAFTTTPFDMQSRNKKTNVLHCITEIVTEETVYPETVIAEPITEETLPEQNAGCILSTLSQSMSIALSPIKCNIQNMSTSPLKRVYIVSESDLSDTSADYVLSDDIEYVEEPEVEREEHQKLMLQETLTSIQREPQLCLGIPPKSYYVVKVLEEEVCAPLPNILLTLRKIRLDESYAMLALYFGMSENNVGNIFTSILKLVATALQELIFWPVAHKIKENLPISFRLRYSKVQSVIDCLEIQIEKPSSPVHQEASWSEDKNCNTAKYLISCTPDGLVNYVSEGYGGRITDTALINDCGYYKFLKPGMHIMADRGFTNIGGVLKQLGCILVRPPSVVENTKCTKQEAKEGMRIAALRIHVERVIGRLREFKMLKPDATTDNHHVQLLDYIVVCACGIINVQENLIA